MYLKEGFYELLATDENLRVAAELGRRLKPRLAKVDYTVDKRDPEDIVTKMCVYKTSKEEEEELRPHYKALILDFQDYQSGIQLQNRFTAAAEREAREGATNHLRSLLFYPLPYYRSGNSRG